MKNLILFFVIVCAFSSCNKCQKCSHFYKNNIGIETTFCGNDLTQVQTTGTPDSFWVCI